MHRSTLASESLYSKNYAAYILRNISYEIFIATYHTHNGNISFGNFMHRIIELIGA